jgi:hypothetical protein
MFAFALLLSGIADIKTRPDPEGPSTAKVEHSNPFVAASANSRGNNGNNSNNGKIGANAYNGSDNANATRWENRVKPTQRGIRCSPKNLHTLSR